MVSDSDGIAGFLFLYLKKADMVSRYFTRICNAQVLFGKPNKERQFKLIAFDGLIGFLFLDACQ